MKKRLTRIMISFKLGDYENAHASAQKILNTIDPDSVEAKQIACVAKKLKPGFKPSDYDRDSGCLDLDADSIELHGFWIPEEYERWRLEILTKADRLVTVGKYLEARELAQEVLTRLDPHDPVAQRIDCVTAVKMKGPPFDYEEIQKCPPFQHIRRDRLEHYDPTLHNHYIVP